MEIKVTKSTNRRPNRPKDSELGFGKYTTDHMFLIDYASGKGWYDARIVPYQTLNLDPAAMVLHYNQQVFEGLKAYALADGGIGLFRPERNVLRMNTSSQRMVMPEVDSQLFLQAIKELVLVDREWLPTSEGTSLYIRPTMIATEPMIGIRASERFLFYIILCPVGAYYPEGFNPTRIYVSDTYVRTAEHGVGNVKTSGNYGPTILISQEASMKGYTQVLWLDANELKYVEEVGTSNVFFLIDGELISPPLKGTILPGITRDSALQLARRWGLCVSERSISINEVVDACEDGTLKEMFATGTAAVISPVGEICYKGKQSVIADGKIGELAQKLYDELTGIQYGHKADPFEWRVRVA